MLLVSLILVLGASAGHAAWLVFNINWLYGSRHRGWWVTGLRHLHEFAIVAGPIVFLAWWGPFLVAGGSWFELPVALILYLCVCWFLGFGAFPYQTIKRLLRRPPVLQLSNHSAVIDIARAIGRKPFGSGKKGLVARMPFNQIFEVEFNEKTFTLPQLPAAWDGLSILHLSDLHLCGTPELVFYERLMDECAKQPADILALTGDIVDSNRHYGWIAPVLSRLKWNLSAFAILGNHDSYFDPAWVESELTALGIEPLGHRWTERTIRGEPLIVIGNEMPWLPPRPELKDCPKGGFRLCLSHSPDQLPWAKQCHIDLMLAGHNHGGQICFPIIGPILVPSQFSRRYDCGTFFESPTLLHVSRGLAGTYPLRYGCRPEVTRIVLRK
jgi:predicted MPP superfamily phosphohydrolase